MDRPTIAVVDNDLHRILDMVLTFEGFRVRAYERATNSTLAELIEAPPDLLVCDGTNPPLGGHGLIEGLRHHVNTPVLIYSAWARELYWDLVKSGIWIEAYINKPGTNERLAERIRTTLISADPVRFSGLRKPKPVMPIMERGRLRLDPNQNVCTWDGKPVPLSLMDYLVLEELARRPGIIRSRDALMDAAYQDRFVNDRVIDSHVKAVRRGLRSVDADSDLIETLYGVGYRMKAV